MSARRFAIPFECPCCGAAPDTEMPIHLTRTVDRKVAAESAFALAFPYCQRCVAHVAMWEASGMIGFGVMLGGIIAAVVVAIAIHVIVGLVVVAAIGPVAWLLRNSRRAKAKASQGESCACPNRALAYLGWSGAESAFDFESHTYAARFAEQNQPLLAHASTQLSRLIEGHRFARLAVPTPAAALPVLPPPATLPDWIGRIDAARGAVARRNTLSRALDALHEPADRQAVVAAAVRHELAPVAEETDGLSAVAARGRLQRAIDSFRADNIPEELQAAVLRELDVRWRKLG